MFFIMMCRILYTLIFIWTHYGSAYSKDESTTTKMSTPNDTILINSDKQDEVMHFKIGFLAPWTFISQDFSALTSASAVSMAIEQAHSRIGDQIRFSVVSYNSDCNSKNAAGNAVKLMIEDKVDVFIGPPCSDACRPVAELASYWNKPIISWVATDSEFTDRFKFSTLSRILGPFSKMGDFILSIFEKYNWNIVSVIGSSGFPWGDAYRSIRKTFRDNNITISYQRQYKLFPKDVLLTKILSQVKEESRIVVILTSKLDERKILLKAHEMSMTNSDYVYITVALLSDEDDLKPEVMWQKGDSTDAIARKAYESVFHVTCAVLPNDALTDFKSAVALRMRQPPWNKYVLESGVDINDITFGDKFSPYLYDAVTLYAMSVNESISNGKDPRNGISLSRQQRSRSFKGMTGVIIMDESGDRDPDYWLTDMQTDGSFAPIGRLMYDTDTLIPMLILDLAAPRWGNGQVGDEFAPPAVPVCGFLGEKCVQGEIPVWLIIVIVILVSAVIAIGIGLAIFVYKKTQQEASMNEENWRVKFEDIHSVKANVGSMPTVGSDATIAKSGSQLSNSDAAFSSRPSLGTGTGQLFTEAACYKNLVVAIKHIQKQHMQTNRKVLLEISVVKDISHDNLNIFVGACIDPPNLCLLWLYCSKGSLQDVLGDDKIKLDNAFKLSFMTDIVKGMQYLHGSHLGSHGNLKSSNCLVDTRWTLKITDYGLPSFVMGQTHDEAEADLLKRKLWTAPELLRENLPPLLGTQKGDVYSFAIICYEIIMRTEPYSFDEITPRDVISRIRNGESIPFRPNLPESTDIPLKLVNMIKVCWNENPDQRPSFHSIRDSLKKITGGEVNILDRILSMMEKFAYNLEEIIEERTTQLVEEKKKTDRLLYRMLPSSVAEALKAGEFVQPENFDQCTIYFSDIVGFTQLASDSNPIQIVDFLNDLYICFDDVIERHDVFKVETIGDAYMCVSGVPVRNGTRHAAEIANCALDLLSEVTHFRIRHRPNQQLQLRIGLHSGPVVAGVVGNTMPRYCLFGDTVNTAARMESNGKPLHVHISKVLHNILTELGGYEMTLRGEMAVKGKGMQLTYWLHGKRGFDKPLPLFDAQAPEQYPADYGRSGGTKSSLHQRTGTSMDSAANPI